MSGLQLVFLEFEEGNWKGGVMDVVMDTHVIGTDDPALRCGKVQAA